MDLDYVEIKTLFGNCSAKFMIYLSCFAACAAFLAHQFTDYFSTLPHRFRLLHSFTFWKVRSGSIKCEFTSKPIFISNRNFPNFLFWLFKHNFIFTRLGCGSRVACHVSRNKTCAILTTFENWTIRFGCIHCWSRINYILLGNRFSYFCHHSSWRALFFYFRIICSNANANSLKCR